MSLFGAILVPLDGSRLAAQSVGCAAWLASKLNARLHILSATPRERPAREELTRLQVAEEHWPLVTLHQAPEYPESAIMAALLRYDASLVVMTARGESAEGAAELDPSRIVGHVTQAVIEASPVPVLLLPPAYREALPWERLLVPASGEVDADAALALAVRLAHILGLEVHVAHVADVQAGDESLEARTRYADALHHEYPHQFEEFVRRALPQRSLEERRRIVDVALCRGDVGAELAALIERKQISALVVGWHGRFMAGRAPVLRHLLQVSTNPVLLVRAEARMPFRLKVGDEIE